MPETQQETEDRVRRQTIVDGRLDGHDRRLAAINGQLERGARATELLANRITQLDGSIDALASDLKTKAAVADALRARADLAIKQQVTKREFWLGVAVVIVAILS